MTRYLFAIILLCVAAVATAQVNAPAAPTSPTPPAPPAVSDSDSHQVRGDLHELLQRYPPEVGRVLKIDPALWSNEKYLAAYPGLADFVAKHPEVAHNSQFYLDGVWVPDQPTPQSESIRVWRDTVEGITIFAIVLVFTSTFVWLIRTVIEQRRWTRLSTVQNEVHNKLLDRFGSNEDLLAYMQSPAGKGFLQAAPIPLDAGPRAVSAPIARILWSVQVGLVVGLAGIGLQFVSWNVDKEVAQPLFAIGVLAISIGAGFVLSAVVSYMLSRRLGLWHAPAPATAE